MRRGWWRDVLAGAATLMDVSGTGTRTRWPRTPMARVTWAVTDEDLGPGWVSQEAAGVEPVPAQVTWTYHQWRAQQETAAEWSGTPAARPVQVLVTAREVRRVEGNALLVPGKVPQPWADWIRFSADAP